MTRVSSASRGRRKSWRDCCQSLANTCYGPGCTPSKAPTCWTSPIGKPCSSAVSDNDGGHCQDCCQNVIDAMIIFQATIAAMMPGKTFVSLPSSGTYYVSCQTACENACSAVPTAQATNAHLAAVAWNAWLTCGEVSGQKKMVLYWFQLVLKALEAAARAGG